MTLCWASEVVIYACMPDEVPEYATMCATSLAGTALMLVPFGRRGGGGAAFVDAGSLAQIVDFGAFRARARL